MDKTGIHILDMPELEKPLLIAGFDGWGNALNISSGMVAYLIRHFKAQQFAELEPDTFYRYDEQRPRVIIEDGQCDSIVVLVEFSNQIIQYIFSHHA